MFKKFIILLAFFSLSIHVNSQKTDFFELAKQLEIFTSAYKELNMYYMDELNPAELNEIRIPTTLMNKG